MASWQRFCKSKIEKIEKVWNRKLDEKHKDEDDEEKDSNEDKAEEDEQDDFEANMKRIEENEKNISDILAKMPQRRREPVDRQKSQSFVEKSQPDKDIKEAAEAALAEQRAKDDSDVKKKQAEFDQNQYWKVPDQYDLDELLAEQKEEEQKLSTVDNDGSEHLTQDLQSPIFAVTATANNDDDLKESEPSEPTPGDADEAKTESKEDAQAPQ